jgi:NTP pyrophosphatase (non-canonical NTP hydrolase)
MTRFGDLDDLQGRSADAFDAFERIEPRPWDERTLALELAAEVGSLTHAVLDMEGYKRRCGLVAAVKDEASDVLFIALRLCSRLGVSLVGPVDSPAATDPEERSVEDMALELVRLAGDVANDLATGRREPVGGKLGEMATWTGQVAAHYGFSLQTAYTRELRKCRAWQVKTLAQKRWGDRRRSRGARRR